MSSFTLLAQVATDAVTTAPDWTLIGIIIAVFVVAAIFLLIPSKPQLPADDKDQLPNPDKASKPLSDSDDDKKEKHDKEKIDKDNLSLAEIKEAKRDETASDKSREELRELRRERRADVQTDKAIQEREESEKSAGESKLPVEDAANNSENHAPSDVADNSDKDKIALDNSENKSNNANNADELFDKKQESSNITQKDETKNISASIDDIITRSDADTGDVFASLFGNDSVDLFADADTIKNDFSSTSAPKDEHATIFPTLGSALIPLNQITESAKNAEKNDLDPLDEITRRLEARAEKKTLN